MIIRFENIFNTDSFNRDLCDSEVRQLKSKALCCIEDRFYWINNVIEFNSHINVLITPVLAVVPTNKELALFARLGQEVIDNLIYQKVQQTPGESAIEDSKSGASYPLVNMKNAKRQLIKAHHTQGSWVTEDRPGTQSE